MAMDLKLSETVRQSLRCPRCRARLELGDRDLVCADRSCGARFPVLDGVPVLLNEQASVFAVADFVCGRQTFFYTGRRKWRERWRRFLPQISKNIKAKGNYRRLADELLMRSARPRVLVLGGSIPGKGMESLAERPAVELIESDVSFGVLTQLICDAHDIPFADQSFDGVVLQAVLEHVVDPSRCVEEAHRVLRPGGLVYAETPFMQQVHGGRYDFTRFTHLGHRCLFRKFAEIDSGATCGPGMALAWSYQHFLMSFATSRLLRVLLMDFASLTSFGLKYFDHLLIDKPGALDAASGCYFLGSKSECVLTDRELIALYRGAM